MQRQVLMLMRTGLELHELRYILEDGLSVEDQQGIYKLAMDVCEYIFQYDSHSDNGQ